MKKKETKETAAIPAICRRFLTTLLSISFFLCLKEVYCPGVELSVGGSCNVRLSATSGLGPCFPPCIGEEFCRNGFVAHLET